MIPVLFASNATTFNTNGIGRLADVVSLTAEEELNGINEITVQYLANGQFADQIVQGNIIVCKPNKKQNKQAYRITKVSKPLNQIITIEANHISYDMGYIPVEPFTATGITATIAGLMNNAMVSNNFTFTTDLTNETSSYNQTLLKSMRACLGGSENSVLQTFSGSNGVEYEFDNFNTFITLNRGADNGVSIRYGKNLTDILQEISNDNLFTSAVAYWTNADNTICVYGDIQHSSYEPLYNFVRTATIDASGDFEQEPTPAELNNYALQKVEQQAVGLPSENLTISFVDLADTQEYKGIANLEAVNLADTVRIYYPPLKVDTTTKVIRTKFDGLTERYIEIELGAFKSELGKTLASAINDFASVVNTTNKVVSVITTIDTELGEIQSTVNSLEGLADTVEQHTTQITQNANAITQKVSQSELDDALNEYVTQTQLEQTADSLTLGITQAQSSADNANAYNQQLQTYITMDINGITIGKNDSDIRGQFTNTSLDFINGNDEKKAWVDADVGLGGKSLALGDPTDIDKQWRFVVSDDGNVLSITRRKA